MRRPVSLTHQQKWARFALFHQINPESKISEYISKSKTAVHNFIAAKGVQKIKMLSGPKEISETLSFACFLGMHRLKMTVVEILRAIWIFLHPSSVYSS